MCHRNLVSYNIFTFDQSWPQIKILETTTFVVDLMTPCHTCSIPFFFVYIISYSFDESGVDFNAFPGMAMRKIESV